MRRPREHGRGWGSWRVWKSRNATRRARNVLTLGHLSCRTVHDRIGRERENWARLSWRSELGIGRWMLPFCSI